ncbi:MAG TPA: TGS domain-containing protein, partial [Aigarchaeota archaeon]|nr:TGS domain-containing protein [Aigarchaeota archaeon]
REKAEELKHMVSEYGLPITPFSILYKDRYASRIKETMFKSLEIIRIYTQKDGVTSNKPIVLHRGATVLELAQAIHREFAEKLQYARVWGKSVKIQGQQVGPSHVLEDGDIVEIHI